MTGLLFSLDLRKPERRSIAVRLEFDRDFGQPGASPMPRGTEEVEFFLPTWTPGSYLIREYSRHLNDLEAIDAGSGAPLRAWKVAKNRFRIAVPPDCQRVRAEYSIYAHELTVRTAHVDADHAYWNGACVFLWPVDLPGVAARIRVDYPAHWDLATTLPRLEGGTGFAELRADGLDQLVDSPCLAGRSQRLEWTHGNRPHAMILDGIDEALVPTGLLDDLKAVVAETHAVFGGELPYERYLFLALFSDSGHGGLEHRDCSTLLAPRTDLAGGKSYRQFLGLVAHEFFHVWNVKRMRPAELWEFDYEAENYTPMLWLAEGFTAYYDDYVCLRAGVLDPDGYLAIVARNLGNLLGSRGRFHQSLAESSFDAWIRLYRPDENLRNTSQNYYVHGALAALFLDLSIRRATGGARSLDDAVANLYRSTYEAGRGYRRDDVERCLGQAAGRDLAETLGELVDGNLDPDFPALFDAFGLEVVHKERDKPYLGVAFRSGGTSVAQVVEGSPAWEAGVAPGDELLAVQDLRVTDGNWQKVFDAVARIGAPLQLLLSRRGRIVRLQLQPSEQPVGKLAIRPRGDATPEAVALRTGWLGDKDE